MVVNMVIVDNDVERGAATGEAIAALVGERSIGPWTVSVHVRKAANKITDDNFRKYQG